jgi:hypothetical protein
VRSSESICAEYLSASLRLLESCAQIARLEHTPRKEAAVGRWRWGDRVPRGGLRGRGACRRRSAGRRRCPRRATAPRRRRRRRGASSPPPMLPPSAPPGEVDLVGLARGVGTRGWISRGLSPRGWLGLDRCGCLCSAALFVARIFIYFLFPVCFYGSIGIR